MMLDPLSRPTKPISWLELLLWFFLLFALLMVASYVLHRNSYCIGEGRFIPDSEAIDAAIREELRFLDARREIRGRKIVPFKDKQEFLNLNPKCCKILRGDEEREAYNFMGVFSIITGYYSSAVEVKYMLKIADANGQLVETVANPIIVVDACGISRAGENTIKKYQVPD